MTKSEMNSKSDNNIQQSFRSESKYREDESKKFKRSKRKKGGFFKAFLLAVAACVILLSSGAAVYLLTEEEVSPLDGYILSAYNKSLCSGDLFACNLCVSADEVALKGYSPDSSLHGAALFDVGGEKVVFGHNMYDRLYPASTTKLMTAYLAIKHGNPDDIVTVSEKAVQFRWDEVVCHLKVEDKVTLYDLLCGLLLRSGNDCGVAIAEHISGSVEDFAALMNEEAMKLGATSSHFVNPHGLHDENHYTTAYDLYLIFNACIKEPLFMEIISKDSYTGTLTGAKGDVRTETWLPTNYYSLGKTEAPSGVTVFGGKTGTTNEAGSCVILYSEDSGGKPYISVVMGAKDKTMLYRETGSLLAAGIP